MSRGSSSRRREVTRENPAFLAWPMWRGLHPGKPRVAYVRSQQQYCGQFKEKSN